jgi:hypothetical protein
LASAQSPSTRSAGSHPLEVAESKDIVIEPIVAAAAHESRNVRRFRRGSWYGRASSGKWSFQPSKLLFTNAQEWVVVRKGGELLLLKIHDEGPDDWNKYRAYSREH